uniref:Uncharacterized protein n=2 Tax=Helianthus annuus TaxID=4232 RepID=A0A251S2N1_HELAN
MCLSRVTDLTRIRLVQRTRMRLVLRTRMPTSLVQRTRMRLVLAGPRTWASKGDDIAWWVDSGATGHVCKDLR